MWHNKYKKNYVKQLGFSYGNKEKIKKKNVGKWPICIDHFSILLYNKSMENLKRDKKIQILKIALVLIWMVVVFNFSNQPGTESSSTSSGFTEKIINIPTFSSNLTQEERIEIITKAEPVVRKLAHYSLYTVGGMLIMNFVNTYELNIKKKVLISVIIGAVYAGTDEFHQYFIEGREASLTDVGIDTLGVITGVCMFLCLLKVIGIIRKKVKILNKKRSCN